MKKALVVGIDSYPAKPLAGCVNDARQVAKLLSRHGDGEPNFDVELLTAPVPGPDGNVPPPEDPDTELSKPALPKVLLGRKIRELFTGDAEIQLFYFAGHGLLTSVGGYLATSDTQSYDEGVAMDEILSYANQSKGREKIIILDCCHSGAFGSPSINGTRVCELAEGMVVLTAARDSEESKENKSGHGVFTSLMVEALNGAAADLLGQVTPGAIYHYVDQSLGSWEQRPIFKTHVTSWTPLRTVPPGPDSPAIARDVLRRLVTYFPDPDQELKLTPEYEASAPGSDPAKVAIFKDLQAYAGVDLLVPVGEQEMYWAAMKSQSCKLTAFGKRYWRLVKHNRV